MLPQNYKIALYFKKDLYNFFSCINCLAYRDILISIKNSVLHEIYNNYNVN